MGKKKTWKIYLKQIARNMHYIFVCIQCIPYSSLSCILISYHPRKGLLHLREFMDQLNLMKYCDYKAWKSLSETSHAQSIFFLCSEIVHFPCFPINCILSVVCVQFNCILYFVSEPLNM